MPLNFGIAMSRINKSGCCSSQSLTASSPSAASATMETSAASSNPRSPLLTMLWSSASSTRKRRLRQESGYRQAHLDGRPPRPARRDDDGSLQVLDPLVNPNQAQAPAAMLRLQAHAIVADRELELALAVTRAHVDRDVVCVGMANAIGQASCTTR